MIAEFLARIFAVLSELILRKWEEEDLMPGYMLVRASIMSAIALINAQLS